MSQSPKHTDVTGGAREVPTEPYVRVASSFEYDRSLERFLV
jgi:hypothetical protein